LSSRSSSNAEDSSSTPCATCRCSNFTPAKSSYKWQFASGKRDRTSKNAKPPKPLMLKSTRWFALWKTRSDWSSKVSTKTSLPKVDAEKVVTGKSGEWGSDLSDAADILYPDGDPCLSCPPGLVSSRSDGPHRAELTSFAADSLGENTEVRCDSVTEEEYAKAHEGKSG
jgi:hypothetical protein